MDANKIREISNVIIEIEDILKNKGAWWGIHDNNNKRIDFNAKSIVHSELVNVLKREKERLLSELKKQLSEE